MCTLPLEGIHETTQWSHVDETRLHNIPATGPNRTLMDLAGVVDYGSFEIAVDSALRLKLVTWPSLTRESFERDPRRRNRLAALEWTVLVVTWADVAQRPAEVVSTARQVLDR